MKKIDLMEFIKMEIINNVTEIIPLILTKTVVEEVSCTETVITLFPSEDKEVFLSKEEVFVNGIRKDYKEGVKDINHIVKLILLEGYEYRLSNQCLF